MTIEIAITSNYAESTGDPQPHLERIAEAGFSHVLWAHHAWSDYIYTEPEIEHLARCLEATGLALNDLHCPTGKEQKWGSPVEHERLAGIELVKNRIAMAARLGCDVVVCHIPTEPDDPAEQRVFWDRQRRTMDALQPLATELGVRLALENTLPGNFDTLEKFLAMYGPEFLGLCYDSGHGNARVDWPGDGLQRATRIKDRIIDLHLHDNDGTGDHHRMLFSGTVDWAAVAGLIPGSGYTKGVVPIEVGMEQTGFQDEAEFLRQVYQTGLRFAELMAAARES